MNSLRPTNSTPNDASRTITIHDLQPQSEGVADGSGPSQVVGTLRLRGLPSRTRPSVSWDDDVVDNEGMGKKKSKICCIYHKPKRFDESSDEDSSDESSDSDASASGARPSRAFQNRRHHHMHQHDDGCSHMHGVEDKGEDVNAYESAPRPRKGKGPAP